MWLLKGLFLFVIISIFGLITLVSLIFFILKRKDNRKKKIWLTVFLSSCIISISLSIYTGIKVIGKFIDKTGSLIAEAGDGIHFGGLETYRYWAESEPSPDTKVLNGQYKSSIHFTKEYVMYLELETKWTKDFAKDNGLHLAKSDPVIPNDAPKWFNPPKVYEIWEGNQGSTYFINSKTGHMYIYEVQF